MTTCFLHLSSPLIHNTTLAKKKQAQQRTPSDRGQLPYSSSHQPDRSSVHFGPSFFLLLQMTVFEVSTVGRWGLHMLQEVMRGDVSYSHKLLSPFFDYSTHVYTQDDTAIHTIKAHFQHINHTCRKAEQNLTGKSFCTLVQKY